MSSSKQLSQHPSGRRYPPELKERAVRMVREATAESGERFGVVTRVARQLGVGAETLRLWVNQAEVDAGAVDDGFRRLACAGAPWINFRPAVRLVESCPTQSKRDAQLSGTLPDRRSSLRRGS